MSTSLLRVFLLLSTLATATSKKNGNRHTTTTTTTTLLSFLDQLDQKRKTTKRSYSILLDTIANQTRVDISVGNAKRITSTLPAAGSPSSSSSSSAPPVSDWMDIGESADVSAVSWYNPMYSLWYMTHLFHTTTIEVSCHEGGTNGDSDLDHIDGCNIHHLRIDVSEIYPKKKKKKNSFFSVVLVSLYHSRC